MITHVFRPMAERYYARLAASCLVATLGIWLPAVGGAGEPSSRTTMLVVVGAAGTPEYGQRFQDWLRRWRANAERAHADLILIGPADQAGVAKDTDRATLEREVRRQAKLGTSPLWIILIGHGTYDGKSAKFNLRGPDVAAHELADWLTDCKRPLVLIDCSSSSGPFINRLSAKRRIIVTATNSGAELNYARFGDFISRTIADPAADLDRDQQISVLEAFLAASAGVREFYVQNARLATEHALIDDNGDGQGTPASWFRGVHVQRRAQEGAEADGLRANQMHLVPSARELAMPAELRRQRDQLEQQLEQLRKQKDRLTADAYYRQLEALAVPLARIYAQANTGSHADSRGK